MNQNLKLHWPWNRCQGDQSPRRCHGPRRRSFQKPYRPRTRRIRIHIRLRSRWQIAIGFDQKSRASSRSTISTSFSAISPSSIHREVFLCLEFRSDWCESFGGARSPQLFKAATNNNSVSATLFFLKKNYFLSFSSLDRFFFCLIFPYIWIDFFKGLSIV